MRRLEAYRVLPTASVTNTEGYWVDTENTRLLDIQCGGSAAINGYSQYELIELMASKQKNVSFLRGNISQTCNDTEQLTETLGRLTGYEAVFYTVTGTSAVEATYNMLSDRKWITTIDGYHGSSYLAHILSDNGSVEIGDYDQLEEQLKDNPGAVFFTETVSWRNLDTWDFSILRGLCDRYDALLVVDDIAMCNWRGSNQLLTTSLADVVLMGKANTSGYAPLSVVLFNDKTCRLIKNEVITYGHTFHPYLPGITAMQWTLDNTKVQTDNIEQRHKLIGDQLLDLGYVKDIKTSGTYMIMQVEFQPNYIDFYNVGLEHFTSSKQIMVNTMQIADDTYFNQLESRLCDLLETKLYGKSL